MKKIAYLSENADGRLTSYLRAKGYELSEVRPAAGMHSPIASHPDIYMCRLGDEIYRGDPSLLGDEYPKDVLYNAAQVGRYFLCSKYCSKDLVCRAEGLGLTVIRLAQGYVKCNLVCADEKHVITEDEGIAKTLKEKTDIDCLLITKGSVLLPGYKYGFIGGASGKAGNEIIFNGDLSAHPDCEKIRSFIESCGLDIKYFPEYPLTDIGSIICSD